MLKYSNEHSKKSKSGKVSHIFVVSVDLCLGECALNLKLYFSISNPLSHKRARSIFIRNRETNIHAVLLI